MNFVTALMMLTAFVFASLVEYWMHRLMHFSHKIGERHRDHHRRNEGQGVIWEFRDYVKGSFIVLCPVFFVSWSAGIGWFLGGIIICCFFCLSKNRGFKTPPNGGVTIHRLTL